MDQRTWHVPELGKTRLDALCRPRHLQGYCLDQEIRMGPGIRPLPFFHPLQVATDVAVCDHLTDGRYIAGFGLGIGTGNGQRGELPGDRRVMMREAIDLILRA